MSGLVVGRGRQPVGVVATALLVALAAAFFFFEPSSARSSPTAVSGSSVVHRASATIAYPSRGRGATLARIAVGVHARSRPGAGRGVWWVGTETGWSKEPQVLLVLGSAFHRGREWLRVLLPIRPDGATAWIPRDNAVLQATRYWITVDKKARMVTIYLRGTRLHRFQAVIGKPATPTPDGLAAIYEKDPQPNPHAFLGPWALPLTILSHALFNYGGGPGRIAIHGRDAASLNDPLGSARSHGCIRIDNKPIEWMAHHIPQGTPVQITG
jgi:lipoprotein-anchoring transpeptidase ErfK/SrfK